MDDSPVEQGYIQYSGLLTTRDVLDKSALYGGSQEASLLRAWQPQAARPAAKKMRAAGGSEESGT